MQSRLSSYSYGKSSHLKPHINKHNELKPYKCERPGCEEAFYRNDLLNRYPIFAKSMQESRVSDISEDQSMTISRMCHVDSARKCSAGKTTGTNTRSELIRVKCHQLNSLIQPHPPPPSRMYLNQFMYRFYHNTNICIVMP